MLLDQQPKPQEQLLRMTQGFLFQKSPFYPFLARGKDPNQGELPALASLSMSFSQVHTAEAAQPSPGPELTRIIGCRSTQSNRINPTCSKPRKQTSSSRGKTRHSFSPTSSSVRILLFFPNPYYPRKSSWKEFRLLMSWFNVGYSAG